MPATARSVARMAQESMFDTLKEWLIAGNPGFVTKDDMARLESRVDELLELMDEIEARLEAPRDASGLNGHGDDE